MTDLAPEVPTPAPEPAPAVEPQTVDEWKAKYQAEVQGRIKERNIYRPAQRLLADLDDDEREAILTLTELVRNGDAEAIAEWSLRTAENVTGKSRADLIAAQQAAGPNTTTELSSAAAGQAQATAQGITDPAEIARIVQEAIQADRAELQRQQRTQSLVESMSAQMRDAGYDPATPSGKAIIMIARENGGDMAAAIETFNNDVLRAAQAQAQAQVAAAQRVGTPAPNGSAPASAPAANMSPGDLMRVRLGLAPGGKATA